MDSSVPAYTLSFWVSLLLPRLLHTASGSWDPKQWSLAVSEKCSSGKRVLILSELQVRTNKDSLVGGVFLGPIRQVGQIVIRWQFSGNGALKELPCSAPSGGFQATGFLLDCWLLVSNTTAEPGRKYGHWESWKVTKLAVPTKTQILFLFCFWMNAPWIAVSSRLISIVLKRLWSCLPVFSLLLWRTIFGGSYFAIFPGILPSTLIKCCFPQGYILSCFLFLFHKLSLGNIIPA